MLNLLSWAGSKFKKGLLQEKPRIPVVTGIGIVSAIGIGKDQFWNRLVRRETGIDFIRSFDPSSFPCQLGAEIKNAPFRDHLSRVQMAYYTLSTKYAFIAYQLAKQDSAITHFDPLRTDVIMGTALTSFDYIEREVMKNSVSLFGGFDPTGISKLSLSSAAAAIASTEKLRGQVLAVSTACASGLSAIGVSMDRIRAGQADMVITGASDTGVTKFLLNLFCSAKFVSFETKNPERAVCPFDLARTRSVLGDAACVLVLEDEAIAKARGAKIYARLTSYVQETENVSGVFQPDESGTRWADTISRAIASDSKPIDYINAHATGDTMLDPIESSALARVFGSHLQNTWIGSIKGSVGSPLGAAGALQVATSALAIKNQVIPPSCGFETPDPACAVKVVGKEAVRGPIQRALVNGRAVGGVNAALVLDKAA